jgi:hypothetical protein
MFLLLFPNIQANLTPAKQIQQEAVMPCPINTPKSSGSSTFLTSEDIPLPVTKDSPQIQLRVQKEIPKTEEELRKELENQTQTAFEQKLVSILVKINLASCTTCDRDDKKLILQLKMMKSLLDGNPKDAIKWSNELNKYLSINGKLFHRGFR